MENIPVEFWDGVEQFNQQQFYACHDTLEAIWIQADSGEKNFYQGILQVAVALYHLSNQNLRGAVILMGEGIHRLRSFQPAYADLDIENFLEDTVALLKYLQQTNPQEVDKVIRQLGLSQERLTPSYSESSVGIHLPILRRMAN